MIVTNPRNGFVPQLNDLVRVVGACHPRMVGKIVRVISIEPPDPNYKDKYGVGMDYHALTEFSEGPSYTSGELLYTSGEVGGFEFVASEQDIRNLAYALWEKDGGRLSSQEYWEEAVWQLSTDKWNISSGELRLEGEGPLNEVINFAVRYASENNIFLGDTVTLSDCVGRNYTVATPSAIQQLGLA